jgi:hypothetical protein
MQGLASRVDPAIRSAQMHDPTLELFDRADRQRPDLAINDESP